MSELARFLLVTVAGVVLDLGIALALHELLAWPLWLAAASGFAVAAGANYTMHQTWTFRTGPRRLSFARAARYAAVALATLGARVAVVAMLDALLGEGRALAILVCGAGVSFLVNFTLSRTFVFAAPRAGAKAP